ncbi:hypothetical protein [Nocardia amamiensis]|uniref:hypothetical protein n=1 Tax=Nocardia amamiensis TaxID=404578 RepID=UPI000834AA20|nr:hypothetical protein [Nocardia amamiensis]
MSTAFALIDLFSQSRAVEQVLASWRDEDKIAWLAQRGSLVPIEPSAAVQVYRFRSTVGLEAVFFLKQNCFVFLGDHCIAAPPE